ncbi:MAG: polysaccharide pyruvyl transferase family protein [Methanoculleus marisnigri]|nr:polysaccharide pyruvyl transferase family protein [Methanoculleus marisnigri]
MPLDERVVWVHTAPPQDDAVARALHDRCGIHIARRDYRYLKVIGLMKHAGLVLTDRYHACIFAIIAGCPVLPFESNTWKIQGLFTLFEYPLAVQPVLTRETLNDAVESVGQALQLNETCREYVAGIRAQMLARCHWDIAKVWEGFPDDHAPK